MKILAFETSCDDTAVAIVEDGTRVLSHVKHSQIEDHAPYGGVVPEIAARLHSENWRPVFEETLMQASMKVDDLDCLAVTAGPGLQTSLLVGTTAASFLSQLFQKPVIPVHHVQGHIASIILDRSLGDFSFPALCLTVSGGHTDLYEVRSFTDMTRIGWTLDDAAGEAFDKCAKMLGLGYPGGPIVSEWAKKGDPYRFDFPRITLEKTSLNFSFSGLKASIYRLIEQEANPKNSQFIADVCASFQSCVVDIFVKKLNRALDQNPDYRQVYFVGGVSANEILRGKLQEVCEKRRVSFFTTMQFLYSTDNAAMIAAAAYIQYKKNPDIAQVQFIDSNPRLEMMSL